MQLAYGLYPDGYLPRMVIVSDGNQTAGRPRGRGVPRQGARREGLVAHVRSADKTAEVRVVGVTVPDDIKVGQPYEVTAEVWSTEPQTVTLALQQDEFPNGARAAEDRRAARGQEPRQVQERREARRLRRRTSCALTKFEHDTEKQNNAAVMTAPVKGKPSVLYVEGGMLREPGSAGYLQRALEHENIDVDGARPGRHPVEPQGAREVRPRAGLRRPRAPDGRRPDGGARHLRQGHGRRPDHGRRRGLVRLGRLRAHDDREHDAGAVRLREDQGAARHRARARDRPLGLDAGPQARGREGIRARHHRGALARTTTSRSSRSTARRRVLVQPQRAGNRMRISTEIARLQSGGGTNIFPGLKEAFEILQGINAKVKHVILMTDGEAPTDGLAELVQDMRDVAHHGVVRRRAGRRSRHARDDRRRRRRPALHGRGHRLAAEDLHEGDAGGAEEPARRGPRSTSRVAKKVEAIEGTDVENAPPLHGYVTTKPKPTAETILISDLGEPILARWRYGAGTERRVDLRRQEPLGRRLDPLGRLPEVLGAGHPLVDAPQGLRQLRPLREGRRRPRAGHGRRDRLAATSSSTSSTPSSRSSIRRTTRSPQTVADGADRGRPLHRRLQDPEVRQLSAQGRPQARRQDRRRVARLGRPVLPARVPAHDARPRAAASTPRRSPAATIRRKPAQVWDPGTREGRRTRRTSGRGCCSAWSRCSCSTSTRSASGCSATARSSSRTRRSRARARARARVRGRLRLRS